MQFTSVQLEPVQPAEESKFQALMQAHHYLGALPKIGNTIWYVASSDDQRLAFLIFIFVVLSLVSSFFGGGRGYGRSYGTGGGRRGGFSGGGASGGW